MSAPSKQSRQEFDSNASFLPPLPFFDRLVYNPVNSHWYLFPEVERNDPLLQWKTIAASDRPTLIIGERGTGKEDLAGLIVAHSTRPWSNFSVINCGSIAENMIDSELFGHKNNSFTGAIEDRPGRLAALDGGTIFLDELGAMPQPLQVRLLRFIETGEIQTVGDDENKKANVRVVAATNAPEKIIKDLFDRFTHCVKLPPLRDHPDDILRLVLLFLWPYKTYTGITPALLLNLMCHRWPGNVRQMENQFRKVCDLPDNPSATGSDQTHVLTLRAFQELNPSTDERTDLLQRRALISLTETLNARRTSGILAQRVRRIRIDNTLRLLHQMQSEVGNHHPNLSFTRLSENCGWYPIYDTSEILADPHIRTEVLLRGDSWGSLTRKVKSTHSSLWQVMVTTQQWTRCLERRSEGRLPHAPMASFEQPTSTGMSGGSDGGKSPYGQDTLTDGKWLWKFWGDVLPPTDVQKQCGKLLLDLEAEQRAILQLKAHGQSVRQIGEQIGLAPATVQEKIEKLRSRCGDLHADLVRDILKG